MSRAPLIHAHSLGKVYSPGTEAEVVALDHVDLEIAHGDSSRSWAVGLGKSTLMNILGCLDRRARDATNATASTSPRWMPKHWRAAPRKIGFVFQGFNLLPRMDALHNVSMPLPTHAPRTSAPTARAKRSRRWAWAVASTTSPGEMSGGQQQRVAIARALINRRRCCSADEPTGALDLAHRQEVMALFDSLCTKGHTIVLITH
jgi:putative ABC transport system ATP-binding protein